MQVLVEQSQQFLWLRCVCRPLHAASSALFAFVERRTAL